MLQLSFMLLKSVVQYLYISFFNLFFNDQFSSRGKIQQKDMELIFPGMSGDFTSENFSATWYLIENHSESR